MTPMRKRYFTLPLLIAITLPMAAQIFNFSLRTNNQQLIDEALSGAFIKINQSYELCDSVNDEHFGRNGKDYFNIIPFLGIATTKGFVFPSAMLEPWTYDSDYDEYKGQYKPLVSASKYSVLNTDKDLCLDISNQPASSTGITKYLCLLNDTIQQRSGLPIDTVTGIKNGWLIWLSSNTNLVDTDSVRFTSIKKEIEVPIDGGFLHIDKPEISETVYGGVYVSPIQTSIGQLTFTLTGVMVLDDEGWVIDFPFIQRPKETRNLTPINDLPERGKLNQLKKKKK